jgi:hypothetical protein
MPTFADRFVFDGWLGQRAKLFRAPEDAFQQLIGDLLRECSDSGVFVAP